MKKINLTHGEVALVSENDFKELSLYKWRAKKHSNSYDAARNIRLLNGKRATEYMHVVVARNCGLDTSVMIDHIDGNPLNNQRSNLRNATNKENCRNRNFINKNSTSGFKGVTYVEKYKKWQAQIGYNGSRFWLGYFNDIHSAAVAYDEKCIELFKEFANPNFKQRIRGV